MTEIGEGLQSLGGYNKIKIKKKGRFMCRKNYI